MEGLDEWLPPRKRHRNRLTDRAGFIFTSKHDAKCLFFRNFPIPRKFPEIIFARIAPPLRIDVKKVPRSTHADSQPEH